MSTLAKSSLDERTHCKVPAYCHWFAIGLHDVYSSASCQLNQLEPEPEPEPSIGLKIDNETYEIKLSNLNNAHEAIKAAFSSPTQGGFAVRGIMSKSSLIEHELTYTMRFARELDIFLFAKNPSFGACYHQAPSCVKGDASRTTEKCDIYCAPKMGGGNHPNGPVLVADLKTQDFVTAERESALYAVNGISVHKDGDLWEILIGIPGSKTEMQRQVLPLVYKREKKYPATFLRKYKN